MEKAEVLHKRIAQEAGVVLCWTKSLSESSQTSLAFSTNSTNDFHKLHINISTYKHYGESNLHEFCTLLK